MKYEFPRSPKKKKTAAKPEQPKPKSNVSYKVGTWDGKTKSKRTNLPLSSSLTCSVIFSKYIDAYHKAKFDSHHFAERDFETGAGGTSIVLIQSRGDKIVGVWEFDKNGRERTILALPRMI